MEFTDYLLIFGWIFVLVWVPFIIITNKKMHPKALFVLFFAELWERFSFYGMRALLVLYMTKIIFFDMGESLANAKALGIYGAYGALVYGMPVLGGMVADKFTGFRKAIMLGGFLMMMGHFTLAVEGMMFEGNLPLFFTSLALIIVGNGLFKPNISSFLGTFYEKDDPRKDGAFTIFYMGVNIGAFLAPLTCAYLAEHDSFGWDWGFGTAGVGMLIGLIVFGTQLKYFGDLGLAPEKFRQGPERKKILSIIYAAILIAIPFSAIMLNYNHAVELVIPILGLAIVGYLVYVAVTHPKDADGNNMGQRLLVVVVLFFFHAIFWALFEQAGGSLTLFAEKNVDRVVFGSEIPTAAFQSLNPLFIMLLAPVFSWMWVKLRKSGKEPSTPMKFSMGLMQLGLGFLVVVVGAKMFGSDAGLTPLVFLVLMYLLHTTGELFLSPVGLSMVTKLSPAKIVGFVMGAWFLSISLAHTMAAMIGKIASGGSEEGQTELAATESIVVYSDTYLTWGVYFVLGAAVLLLALVPTLRKWMHGIH